MKERMFKINDELEISVGEFGGELFIYIMEDGWQVEIPLASWEKMIDWWRITSLQISFEKAEE